MQIARERILILDDRRGGVQHLQDALQDEYSLIWTRSVQEAINSLDVNSFDLIICGIHLLHESIFDFLKLVRARDGSKATPFICFRVGESAISQATDVHLSYVSQLMGASAYIAMTDLHDPHELKTKIRDTLNLAAKVV